MKSSRNYPVYTINKHAEGLLVGGHPWVYENDILHAPDTEPENGTLAAAYFFKNLAAEGKTKYIELNGEGTIDSIKETLISQLS